MTIIGVQRGEILAADSSREEVVVIARDRDQRQDFTVLRVHGDAHGPGEAIFLDALAELRVEELLEAVVDREDDGVADGRPLKSQGLDLALRRVALDLAPSISSAQVPLVHLLDARASDVINREIARVFELLELALGDRSRVADHRRVEGAVDVGADALRSDLNAREELGALGDRESDLPRHRRL